jgi:putative aldouronate transport system substrate-binding protein
MKGNAKKALAILGIGLCLVGAGWAQTGTKMKITVANYQMEPTPPDAELLKAYENKFGVDFDVFNIDHDKYHELLNVKLAAGEIPDFFYIKQADTLGTYVKQGVLAKLSPELIQKNAPNLWKVITTYAPGYMEMGKVNGIQYGIPSVNPTNIIHIPLIYRADWMKKVGVTKTPETLAEFESLMYKFAKNDPAGTGKKDTYGLSRDGLTAVFGAFGLVPFDVETDYWMLDGGKVINDSVAPAAKQALALLAKWYKDGVIDPEFVTGENQGGYWAISHAFVKGRIGFTAHANYYHWAMPGVFQQVDDSGKKTPNQPGAVAKELLASNPSAQLAYGPPLKGPTGKQGIKQYNRLMNFYCVGKLAENDPAKVAKVLQILDESANPDFVARTSFKFGQEGKYWKLLDKDSEAFNFIAPYDKDESYWSRIGGVLSMEVPYPPKEAGAQWAIQKLGYGKYGIESVIQVGLPKAMKYKDELMKIRDQYYIGIITGAMPVSAFDEFVQKYMASGGAEAQQEANDYYAAQSKK